jgi:hypothetical protein
LQAHENTDKGRRSFAGDTFRDIASPSGTVSALYGVTKGLGAFSSTQ